MDVVHAEDIRNLRRMSFAVRAATVLLVYLSSFLPVFDASHQAHNLSFWADPLLRWDAFHFARIAESGYTHEYEWAFFPGLPIVMRYSASFIQILTGRAVSWDTLLLGGAVSAALLCDTSRTMYELSWELFGSRDIAFATTVLSLLPSSPATLKFAAYTEPFYTYLSYRGMLCCARTQWATAAFYFTLASTFRSTGILLGGFTLWGMVLQPILQDSRTLRKYSSLRPLNLIYAVLLTAMPFAPFLYHQYAAYRAFCVDGNMKWSHVETMLTSAIPRRITSLLLRSIYSHSPSSAPILTTSPTPVEYTLPIKGMSPWCTHYPPLVYTYVQRTYWNSGFLLYWKPLQIPNFLLAAPPLTLMLVFCGWHIRRAFLPQLRRLYATWRGRREHPSIHDASQFLSTNLTPHALHGLLMSLTLFLSAHVQIVLRVAASTPIIYWAAAWLVLDKPGNSTKDMQKQPKGGTLRGIEWGTWWIGWSVGWGFLSVVLWTTGLPPA